CSSAFAIAWKTSAQSSAVRQMGPSRSCVHESVIAPYRLTRPNVGRKPVTPQIVEGLRIDPLVSVPMPNATQPAAVALAGPADDPLDPSFGSHGLLVRPPNHWSPAASSPVASFATSTAPASRSNRTTVASASSVCPLNASDPHCVGYPGTAMMSL